MSMLPKSKIFTIPNCMSLVRLLLIPAFAITFLSGIEFWPILFLLLSALTDLLDGFIARRFNQVSDLGKILDPAADKLTQVAVVACLTTVYFEPMLLLLVVYIIKEFVMLLGGLVMLKWKKQVPSAKWFGKVATFEFYFAMALFLVFPGFLLANPTYITAIIAITMGLIVFSLLMYALQFFGISKKKDS